MVTLDNDTDANVTKIKAFMYDGKAYLLTVQEKEQESQYRTCQWSDIESDIEYEYKRPPVSISSKYY